MFNTGFNGIGGNSKHRVGAIHCAQELRERNMKIAHAGVRGLLAVVPLLRLSGRAILRVPQLVRKRNMLRGQQQNCQHNMQQAAFEGH